MSIFTFILDASVLNAHAVCNALQPGGGGAIFLREFKRRTAEALVKPLIAYKESRNVLRNIHPPKETQSASNNSGDHIVLRNEGGKSTNCYLCKAMGVKSNTIYSCTSCGFGFHVNCFAFYHYP